MLKFWVRPISLDQVQIDTVHIGRYWPEVFFFFFFFFFLLYRHGPPIVQSPNMDLACDLEMCAA